ncbi:hypothetical protein C0Q70_14264 [Pomacea canaliculata]|uniref:Uncharacterized protein n=1 Tax=Pomacea canaliculata TaxID=400727 RepID=A0A2T7NZJ2_POMCA|nr:hypothetical protein C0Q70_14264 [Pomacea canaliculata]
MISMKDFLQANKISLAMMQKQLWETAQSGRANNNNGGFQGGVGPLAILNRKLGQDESVCLPSCNRPLSRPIVKGLTDEVIWKLKGHQNVPFTHTALQDELAGGTHQRHQTQLLSELARCHRQYVGLTTEGLEMTKMSFCYLRGVNDRARVEEKKVHCQIAESESA